MSEFSLDRELNVERNVDATGKKWLIHCERGRHLFYTLPEGARPDSVIPDPLQGKFTKRMLLQSLIEKHVQDSWEHAEQVAQKNARKAQAAKEAQANARKETKESKDTTVASPDVGKQDSDDDKASKGKK